MTTCATSLPIKMLVGEMLRGRRRTGYTARIEAERGYAVRPDILALVGSGQTPDAACQDLLRQVLARLQHATTATTNQRVTISCTTTGTTGTATLTV